MEEEEGEVPEEEEGTTWGGARGRNSIKWGWVERGKGGEGGRRECSTVRRGGR